MSSDSDNSGDNSPETSPSDLIERVERGSFRSGSPVLVGSLLIGQALDNYHKGKRKDYDALVNKLSDPSLKPVHLQRYLRALRGCVSALTKTCDTLVGTVLRVSWANADKETVDEFIEFLTMLVSAQTYFLKACLKMITKLFMPNIPKGKTVDEIDKEEQDRVFSNAHDALQALLEVVPMTPKFLLPVLSECSPYIKKHLDFQTSYVSNLLYITWYLPVLRPDILELVINHITKIDVEVPKHELEDNNTEEDESTQFEVDLESHKDGSEHPEEEAVVEDAMESDMGAKLDALMDILFKYLKDLSYPNGKFNIDSSTELFNHLITSFEKVILTTHACCHVQFIIFFICSLDEVFTNSFLDACWKNVENPGTPAIIRQASAAYMASLIARAKYISISTVKVCLELLVHWVHCYIDAHDHTCMAPDVSKHGPFYSVCQSIFYMFVFRHRQCLELEGGQKFVRKLNFDRIITSRLNPLKFCLPTVVDLFAQTTKLHQIVLCYTVIEKNKRSMLPMSSAISNKVVSHLTLQNPLDSFFPFDPYLLRRSSKYIKPVYQEWEGIEEDEELLDEQQENQKTFDSEDEEEEYMDYGKTPEVDFPELTPDAAMCISPGFAMSPLAAMEHDNRHHRKPKNHHR